MAEFILGLWIGIILGAVGLAYVSVRYYDKQGK